MGSFQYPLLTSLCLAFVVANWSSVRYNASSAIRQAYASGPRGLARMMGSEEVGNWGKIGLEMGR